MFSAAQTSSTLLCSAVQVLLDMRFTKDKAHLVSRLSIGMGKGMLVSANLLAE
jgi:hypothetical protein